MIWVVILFAAGIILVLAEFLIPGMVAGILGTTMIIASAIVAIVNFPEAALVIIIGELIGVAVAVMLGIWLMSRSIVARRLVLQNSQDAGAGWVAVESDMSLKGADGKVFTPLRPAGTIIIKGRRIDAVSDGTFIDAGETVRVIEVNGSRVVVERKAQGE